MDTKAIIFPLLFCFYSTLSVAGISDNFQDCDKASRSDGLQDVSGAHHQFLTKDSQWWLANSFAYKNTFVFSPRRLTWKAYNSRGRVIKSGRASGGRHYCPDIGRSCRTPVGTFRIISKRGANCRSSRYPKPRGGAPMPYCMFFSKFYAIHGSYNVPRHNASHGCIRVRPVAAKWLSRNFIRHGTKVVVLPY